MAVGTESEDAGIEEEAAAAAEEAPATEAPAAPAAPEPAAAKPASKPKSTAKATARKRQTAAKGGKDTAQQTAHRAAVKAARPEAPAAPEPTPEQVASVAAKLENRARLRDIKDRIEALDLDRAALVEEQQILASFGQVEADNRPHHERHAAIKERARELREQRKSDRLKLLAAGAGKSPLDQAMGGGPRKSLAAADANAAEDE